jgi:hypothetical protein
MDRMDNEQRTPKVIEAECHMVAESEVQAAGGRIVYGEAKFEIKMSDLIQNLFGG